MELFRSDNFKLKTVNIKTQFNKMNKLKSIFLLAFILISSYSYSQCKLEIEIINLRSNKGVISLELFDNDHISILSKKELIQNNKCIINIENLKSAKYAIRYIHDENSNDKFDTNWMGIPIEGYGFSNNAYGNFGPESFDKWLFEVEGVTKIVLTTKYMKTFL